MISWRCFLGSREDRAVMAGRNYFVFAFVVLTAVGLSISYSYGEEISQFNYGFSVFGGRGDAWHDRPHMDVYGFLPRFDLRLYRNWYAEFEGNVLYWDISTQRDFYFLGVNGNILFKPIERT
jgi:hypothetical protein